MPQGKSVCLQQILWVVASLSCFPSMAILMFLHYMICLIIVLSKQAKKTDETLGIASNS